MKYLIMVSVYLPNLTKLSQKTRKNYVEWIKCKEG